VQENQQVAVIDQKIKEQDVSVWQKEPFSRKKKKKEQFWGDQSLNGGRKFSICQSRRQTFENPSCIANMRGEGGTKRQMTRHESLVGGENESKTGGGGSFRLKKERKTRGGAI